ncbi:MAG TPA: metallophosphoesterase family protein [Candidatus Dormibacteraeota bacterium]|jgi:putative phosphoesterase
MRVGVVADTHYAEFLDELPAAVFERLAGCELILHAGDVGGPEALEQLRRLAPVQAVRGDHDPDLQDLPRERVLEIEGRRVALIHGNRTRLIEEPVTLLGTLSLGLFWPQVGLHGWLRRRFPEADAIVYGHTHTPIVDRAGQQLVFNPGAVYQTDRAAALRRLRRGPGWFEWSWLQVIRHRRRVPAPSVGVLEIDEHGVRAEVLPLG